MTGRPTCETCLFWNDSAHSCQRHAPRCLDGEHDWAPTNKADFCGEHPDFPAYVASLKRPRPPGEDADDAARCWNDPAGYARDLLAEGLHKRNAPKSEVEQLKKSWDRALIEIGNACGMDRGITVDSIVRSIKGWRSETEKHPIEIVREYAEKATHDEPLNVRLECPECRDDLGMVALEEADVRGDSIVFVKADGPCEKCRDNPPTKPWPPCDAVGCDEPAVFQRVDGTRFYCENHAEESPDTSDEHAFCRECFRTWHPGPGRDEEFRAQRKVIEETGRCAVCALKQVEKGNTIEVDLPADHVEINPAAADILLEARDKLEAEGKLDDEPAPLEQVVPTSPVAFREYRRRPTEVEPPGDNELHCKECGRNFRKKSDDAEQIRRSGICKLCTFKGKPA